MFNTSGYIKRNTFKILYGLIMFIFFNNLLVYLFDIKNKNVKNVNIALKIFSKNTVYKYHIIISRNNIFLK